MANASVVICVSNYLHEYAGAHRAKRMVTNYNRVYAAQFRREIPRRKHGPPKILTVTRLDPGKYPECLIRAIVSLDAKLKIIGQGTCAEFLHELARKLGVADRVEFIDMVPNRDIHLHYHDADIFALASHYEGFCIPILEAMASGLPVVACNTNPIPEILGGEGVVVEKNPKAFEQAFRDLIANPDKRTDLGTAAMKRASTLDGELMEKTRGPAVRSIHVKIGRQNRANFCRRLPLHPMTRSLGCVQSLKSVWESTQGAQVRNSG